MKRLRIDNLKNNVVIVNVNNNYKFKFKKFHNILRFDKIERRRKKNFDPFLEERKCFSFYITEIWNHYTYFILSSFKNRQ